MANKLSTLLVTLLCAATSMSMYYLHQNTNIISKLTNKHKKLKIKLKKQYTTLTKQQNFNQAANAPNQDPKQTMSSNWLHVQKDAKDTVVQVHADVCAFNWLEPYKTPQQGKGTGSGFFINADGDLITNYHVVAQASNVSVQIPSFGRELFDVEVVGISPERDIALLRLKETSKKRIARKLTTIPYLELGNSDKVLRSQEVLALGYPLGQSRLKSTLGIVSGRERLGYFGYFQVTSPLNPGNSGGPAVNQKGEVIGINSRGILEAQSVGYIIPINEVKTALKDLYHIKILRKPTLGGIFTYATNEMVDYLGNPSQGGWYIAKVFDNTLLKSVGIQKDDMLYAINGHEVDMYGELDVPWSEDKVSLFEIMNRYKVGDTMKFLIYRKGKPMTFKFKLEDKYLPAIRTYYQEFEPQARDYEVLGGMVVMNLTVNHIGLLLPRVRELIKYAQPEKQQDPAVVITHVFPNSQCDKAQVLRPGQVIDKINGIKIKTLKDFRHAVTESRQDGYLRINTSDNILAVLGVDKILNDEPTLASRYFYQPSPLLQALKTEPTNNSEAVNA